MNTIEMIEKIKDCIQSEYFDNKLYLSMNQNNDIYTTLRKTKYSPKLIRTQIEQAFGVNWDIPIKQMPVEVADWIHWIMRTERE